MVRSDRQPAYSPRAIRLGRDLEVGLTVKPGSTRNEIILRAAIKAIPSRPAEAAAVTSQRVFNITSTGEAVEQP